MGFLVFLVVVFVFGLAVGALARLAVPGPDPMPIWATAALGIGGSIVGGIVARLLIGSYGGLLFAFLGDPLPALRPAPAAHRAGGAAAAASTLSGARPRGKRRLPVNAQSLSRQT